MYFKSEGDIKVHVLSMCYNCLVSEVHCGATALCHDEFLTCQSILMACKTKYMYY